MGRGPPGLARPRLGEEEEEGKEEGEAWALGPLAWRGGLPLSNCRRWECRLAVAGSEGWQAGLVSTWADKLAHITMR